MAGLYLNRFTVWNSIDAVKEEKGRDASDECDQHQATSAMDAHNVIRKESRPACCLTDCHKRENSSPYLLPKLHFCFICDATKHPYFL